MRSACKALDVKIKPVCPFFMRSAEELDNSARWHANVALKE
jgi:hypothetical protein